MKQNTIKEEYFNRNCIILFDVILDPSLSLSEKILYCIVLESTEDDKNYSVLTNAELGALMGSNKYNTSKLITKLRRANKLEVKVLYAKESRRVIGRELYPLKDDLDRVKKIKKENKTK